ncbi:asparagine synthase family protein [Xanthomonas arboricola]|uniref:asparagine synthase (glutamine-hydrolyzing) n=1 Tax=Xanthomonas arboricola pv. guizotiae TaxID=487867 RepID=A0A2S7A1R5_9XANT|nr:asparagine synthetase B family protein [Xanthomonas arboricola]PPT99677.1 asparagine synthetase B [Xanthomonas arboricola pv. guizotiae]PPU22735.1 asparagine synthetase B [Xanthomonas arboricola pv. guizotiae]
MSDFAGVWRLDGAPVSAVDVVRLDQALEARGIGSRRVWHGGDIAIVHRQHYFTAEDACEAMPWVGGTGAVLAADVVLAARRELAAALGEPPSSCSPDGALLLEALQRWDIDALPRVHGSFALALYRPDQRRLLLARDPVGIRALFVHRGPNLIAFSTRLRALLALPEIPSDLDEQALAGQLVMDRTRATRTIYRSIDRVPMAHVLNMTQEWTRVQRWWSLPQAGVLHLRNDEEVEEAAAEVLDLAVADSLRAPGRVAMCLTGGLDSTSVALSAARQHTAAPLLAFTRFPQAATAAPNARHYYDESPRARLLAASHPGIDWHMVGDDGQDWGEHDAERWLREGAQPTRSPLNMAWFFPLYREMEACGCSVLIGGELGNAFFSNDGLSRLPDLLRDRQWRTLLMQTRALAATEGLSVRKALQRHVLRPFMPIAVIRRWHGLPADIWMCNAALNPQFARELDLRRTLEMSRHRILFRANHPSLAVRREWFLSDAVAMETYGVLRAMSGVDIRMPLADRRVIEFFGSLPLDQFLRDGVSRSLPRRLLAARGAPPEISANRQVGVQHGDWFAHLSARRASMQQQLHTLQDSALARRVLDLPRLQGLLDNWPRDAQAAESKREAYLQMLVYGLQTGGFLAWHERGGR